MQLCIYVKSHLKLCVQNRIFIYFKLFSLSEFELNFLILTSGRILIQHTEEKPYKTIS